MASAAGTISTRTNEIVAQSLTAALELAIHVRAWPRLSTHTNEIDANCTLLFRLTISGSTSAHECARFVRHCGVS